MTPSIRQGEFSFKLEVMERDDCLTSFAGLPLVMELFHRMGLPEFINRTVKIKTQGWKEWELTAACIAMIVAGGEHMDDMRILHSDKAYQSLIKSTKGLPVAKSIERYLKAFHKEELINGCPSPEEEKAWVPKESPELEMLNKVLEHTAKRAIRMGGVKTVTIENDASVAFSNKHGCLGTYKGGTGYLPVIGVIAELGIIMADEFRDGNVPPGYRVKDFFKKCLKVIPKEVEKIRARLDGAYYEHDLMKFCDSEKIEFSITGEKSLGIMRWIKALPESAWKPLKKITDKGEVPTGREWAELEWVSANGTRKTMRKRIRRYLVTRKAEHQWEMFQEEFRAEVTEKDRYELIVTNMYWAGDNLIRWHYERAGSIEHTIDSVKNDFGGSVFPCAEFGANAAWWRLQCIAHNLIRILQIHALPEEFSRCRMKKLRLWLICIAGRVVRTGRQLILRIIGNHPSFEIYKEARLKILHMEIP